MDRTILARHGDTEKPAGIFKAMATAMLLICTIGPWSVHAGDADTVSGATKTYPYGWHGMSGPSGMMPPAMDSEWADELELTLEQRDRLKLIAYEMEPRIRALRDQGKALAGSLKAMTPDEPNYATLTAAASQQAASLAAESVNVMAELRRRMHDVLTDEQRARLKTKIEERRQARQADGETGHPGHGHYWKQPEPSP